jgi:ubiquinone/menaquinone biosynthesis C-methylase UbiE
MKLNLGCGNKRLDGYVNIDIQPRCLPDRVVDLEAIPWPFENNSVDEVVIEHVLEHIGASPDLHRQVIQELYRVCRNGALIKIVFPHPRSDAYLIDPTHVRPLTASTLEMYSKKKCLDLIEKRSPTTPLAIYWGVDFEVESGETILYPYWADRYQKGAISRTDLEFAINSYSNVVSEMRMTLKTVKGF